MTFAEKVAAQAGLVIDVVFEEAHLSLGVGNDIGFFINAGASNPTPAVIDSAVKASGNDSVKFTIPSLSGAGSSGQLFFNFSDDRLTQFGEGETFYVQGMFKYDRYLFEHTFALTSGQGGWKQWIIGTGDPPTCTTGSQGTCVGSHSELEIVLQNTNQYGFPQVYYDNSGTSTPWAVPFGESSFKLQTAVDHGAGANNVRYCLYDTDFAGCIKYSQGLASPGDQVTRWATITQKVTVGTLVGNVYEDCHGEMWLSWTGETAVKLFDYTWDQPFTGAVQKYGKVFVLPYHTNKDATEVHDETYMWAQNFIVATEAIPLETDEEPVEHGAIGETADADYAAGGLVSARGILS